MASVYSDWICVKSVVILVSVLLLISLPNGTLEAQQNERFIPKAGFVPDAKTAIKIAEAVWVPIYGDSTIQAQRPFKAKLIDGHIWEVRASDTESVQPGTITMFFSLYAQIEKNDGRILKVIRER